MYHTFIQRVYRILKHEGKDIDDDLALMIVDDTVGTEVLVPTLLIYVMLPRTGLTVNKPATSTYHLASTMHKASIAVHMLFAQRQKQDALRMRNGSSVTSVHEVSIGKHVLVYRPQKDKW